MYQDLSNRLTFVLISIFFLAGLLPVAAQDKTAPVGSPTPTPEAIFTDVARESGLAFSHFNGMTGKLYLPEIIGPGAAFFDYDNDGDLDVFLVQGKILDPAARPADAVFPWSGARPPAGRLFRNDLRIGPDGARELKFTDVTEKSGIRTAGYGFGAAAGDINNDGFTDLYVCNLGSNELFLNNGDGTFREAAGKIGADDPRWSISASFFDYDRDGWLDLLVVNYAAFDLADQPKCYAPTSAKDYCGPKAFQPVSDSLFRNRGDGTFENATKPSGIAGEYGHGLGVVAADFNDDDWIDVYVANDGDPNQLWINQKNGRFENEAFFSGSAVNREGRAEASMGVDAGDFNGDGTEDLFNTHLIEETHTLYKNTGGAIFEDVTPSSLLGLPDKRLTGFGTAFFDYDNDGRPDIFVANGSVKLIRIIRRPGNESPLDERYPLGQLNQLFRNRGDETFEDVSDRAGPAFGLFEVSRGAAFGDVDNDGDTDILVANNSGPVRLLLNQQGSRNPWLGLRLIGRDGKRDALGARVDIYLPDKKVLRRRVRTDGSYASAHDPRILAGLGRAERVVRVLVVWPGGRREQWRDLPTGRYTLLREGGGEKMGAAETVKPNQDAKAIRR